MNTQEREVMKMALEALEKNKQTHYYCEDTWYSCPQHEDGCANDSVGDECNCGADEANAEIDKAITAIKEALAQPEHDCTRSHPHEDMGKECELRTEIARLTNQQAHRSQAQLQLKMTALERAWFFGYENDIESAMHNLREEIIKEALAQPEQE